jgi:hypothetical protein
MRALCRCVANPECSLRLYSSVENDQYSDQEQWTESVMWWAWDLVRHGPSHCGVDDLDLGPYSMTLCQRLDLLRHQWNHAEYVASSILVVGAFGFATIDDRIAQWAYILTHQAHGIKKVVARTQSISEFLNQWPTAAVLLNTCHIDQAGISHRPTVRPGMPLVYLSPGMPSL